jgi:inosine/guanosine/xanthosine phosphorylase family protein
MRARNSKLQTRQGVYRKWLFLGIVPRKRLPVHAGCHLPRIAPRIVMSLDMKNVIESGAAAIRARFGDDFPRTMLVLGSGIARFADNLEKAQSLGYGDIPGFAPSAVAGHAGKLMVGTLAGQALAIMAGRIHLYEGHPPQAIATLIHILRSLGAERLILTNAAGGLRPDMDPGTLMIIDDHINFSGRNPLIGPNDERFGPRFFDMTYAYDPALRAGLKAAAAKAGVPVRNGVYIYCLGPNFETPAEVRLFGSWGADAVGMSTVPECLAANHCGMKVAGLSLITNLAAGLSGEKLTHDETLSEAAHAYGAIEKLLLAFFADLDA